MKENRTRSDWKKSVKAGRRLHGRLGAWNQPDQGDSIYDYDWHKTVCIQTNWNSGYLDV